MSLSGDFAHRADECMRLAERASTFHDRELFLDMAMAWLGLADKFSRAPTVLGSLQRRGERSPVPMQIEAVRGRRSARDACDPPHRRLTLAAAHGER